jgi:branched-chain amino acid transport system ATP-binding protein
LIRSIAAQGVTVLLIEHDMSFVMNVADRVAVLDFGRLIAQGTPAEVQKNKDVITAYLGAMEAAHV